MKQANRLASLAFFVTALFWAFPAQAQTGRITGMVIDSLSGNPLPGVNVVIVGTIQGASTDTQGNYTITGLEPGTYDLRASFIGYTPKTVEGVEVAAGETTVIDFTMQQQVLGLDNVVVVGYSTQQKVNLTGSVATVSAEEMSELPVPTVTEALQGMAAGIQLMDGGGRPGRANLDLLIRGQGTLGRGDPGSAAASRPLVLIDGVEGDLSTVDMDNVASISVLKDAAAAAIYGSRAANGVILVTTKRGTAQGGLHVTYNGYYGVQDITAWPDRVDTETHMRLANVATRNLLEWCLDGRDPSVESDEECYNNPRYQPRYSEEYIQKTLSGKYPDKYPSNEWLNAIYSPARIQDHTLRISGGSRAARFALSLNYMSQGGMTANTGANRYGLRLNTNFRASEKITGALDVSGSRQWDIIPAEEWASIFFIIHDTPPTRRTRFSDGTYGLNLFGRSPLALTEVSGDEQRVFWDGTITGRLNYDILPGWAEIKTLASFHHGSLDWDLFRTDPNLIETYPDEGIYWGPSFGESRSTSENQTTLRAMIDYGHTFREIHDISGVIGYEQIKYEREEFRAWRSNFYNNKLRQLDMGSAANDGNLGFSREWALRSVYGRLKYTLLDRYLFEFNARYDGSSRFAEGHRYGFFPSFSAGWRISEEPFFNNIDWVDELKLRGSWGRLGNQAVPLYSYYSSINLNIPYYMGNASGAQALGGTTVALVNEELSWETTTVIDFGIDAVLFDGRLNLTGDIYKRRTEDILLSLPIPDMVGLNAPFQNAGVVVNKGWEIAVGWQDDIGEFSYGIDFNLSDNRNEVVDLASTGPYILGGNLNRHIIKEGMPINMWYGLEAVGLFSSYEQIDAHAELPGWETRLGDIIYKDQNNDGIINTEDRVAMGNPNPRYIYGLNINLGWKNFDLGILLYGVGKRDQYLALGFVQGPVWENWTSPWHKDYWTPDNQDARHPAYYANVNRNYYVMNSWWVLDGSFLKLRNVQLGYTLPESLVGRLGVQDVRLYVNGKNLWMHHNLGINLDPEYPLTTGDFYPQTKSFSFGVNVSF